MKGIVKKLIMVIFIALLIAGCSEKNTATSPEKSPTGNSDGEGRFAY